MLKTKMIVMERDEKSILELLGFEKNEKSQALNENLAPWQQEWDDENIKEKSEKTIEIEPEPEQYIRLRCKCGQRIKVLSQYAGKIGRCPKCSAKWRIPEV